MGLTHFVQDKTVSDLMAPFRQQVQMPHGLKVGTDSRHLAMVGTAFDYLLRIDLGRRFPGAVESTWIAERALVNPLEMHLACYDYEAREMLKRSREAVQHYRSLAEPNRGDVAIVATAAISLAKLDVFYREGNVDSHFSRVFSDEVAELVNLLRYVPFDVLTKDADQGLWLNPSFDQVAECIDGADADIIIGTRLIDIKTTLKSVADPSWSDQLLGYFLLIREMRRRGESLPDITSVGFYFSRHAQLWETPTSVWLNNPRFEELERSFWSRVVGAGRWRDWLAQAEEDDDDDDDDLWQ